MRGLLSGSPGLTTGPLSPPRRSASRESRRSPPLCFFGPWQPTHCSTNTGRTRFSNNSASDAEEEEQTTKHTKNTKKRQKDKLFTRLDEVNMVLFFCLFFVFFVCFVVSCL